LDYARGQQHYEQHEDAVLQEVEEQRVAGSQVGKLHVTVTHLHWPPVHELLATLAFFVRIQRGRADPLGLVVDEGASETGRDLVRVVRRRGNQRFFEIGFGREKG